MKRWSSQKGLLIVFPSKPPERPIFRWELRDIPARKGQMAANFLVPSSGPQENMLMASENE